MKKRRNIIESIPIMTTIIVGIIPWLIESLIKTLFSWTIWKFLTRKWKKDKNEVDKDIGDNVS